MERNTMSSSDLNIALQMFNELIQHLAIFCPVIYSRKMGHRINKKRETIKSFLRNIWNL